MTSRFSPDERDEFLGTLSRLGAAGQAETEDEEPFKKRYLPIAEHSRAFDPDVVLIVGDRGSGKSELFRAVFSLNLLPAIARSLPGTQKMPPLNKGSTIWRKGYPIGKDFPDASGQRRFFGNATGDVGRWEAFWFAYLVRTLRKDFSNKDQSALEALFQPPGGDAEACHAVFAKAESKPLLAIDALDQQLAKEDRWIFIGYDELDTLGGYDWQVTNTMISGLTSFWASYARRWQRIRAKLFLRSDLYRRSTSTLGADIAKLAANRAELSWSDRNMYAMLVKRIANSHEGLLERCRRAKIKFTNDVQLGEIPALSSAEDARQLINVICQQYMGANNRKGITYRWVLDHVRDGRKKPHPRSFVRLFERAAEEEINQPRADSNQLLHHISLRRAIDSVSRDHVSQAQTSEWQWLFGVKERLSNLEMPQTRRQLENLLRKDWEKSWGAVRGEDVRPPADDQSTLVDYLLEVGLLRARSDAAVRTGKIDAPDLFMAGLGMKRKGGVRRR